MRHITSTLAAAAALMTIASCGKSASETSLTRSGLDPAKFEADIDGKHTALYTLTNDNGMEVCITNYGGRIVSIMVPDSAGELRDVVLGFDSIGAYLPENNQTDFGAAIGRYANRIREGRFVLDGDTVKLPVNNFGHTLHGGPEGWQYQVYDVVAASDSLLRLCMVSPDGDNGFPGEVTAYVQYLLTPDNDIEITYEATTTAPTVVNLTNHSYFNLSGDATRPVTSHLLTIQADSITPVDSTFMTSGEMMAVEGTPMDFRAAKTVGQDLRRADFEQIKNANGYDHNYVLTTGGDITVPAVVLTEPSTGITLTVYTDQPGMQVYSGNFLDGTVRGKQGIVYAQNTGICLESQHYPDSPNKPQWPTTVLRPGEKYSTMTIFSFNK